MAKAVKRTAPGTAGADGRGAVRRDDVSTGAALAGEAGLGAAGLGGDDARRPGGAGVPEGYRDAGPRPLMVDVAYTRLRDLIITLRLPPGGPVREEALATSFGVGRTPLREAVKRLEAESLVVVHPRRGTFVTPVNLTDHLLICDVRRQLEGLAAERAAENATVADRVRLRDLTERLRAHPGGRKAGMALDGVVHREIHRCAHNHYLEADLERYLNLATRIWYLYLDRLPEVDHRAEHLPMVQAVLDGDPATARAFAIAHVEHFERSVRAAT